MKQRKVVDISTLQLKSAVFCCVVQLVFIFVASLILHQWSKEIYLKSIEKSFLNAVGSSNNELSSELLVDNIAKVKAIILGISQAQDVKANLVVRQDSKFDRCILDSKSPKILFGNDILGCIYVKY